MTSSFLMCCSLTSCSLTPCSLPPDAAKKSVDLVKGEYLKLKVHVDRLIKQSAYSEVNLSKLFHGLSLFAACK